MDEQYFVLRVFRDRKKVDVVAICLTREAAEQAYSALRTIDALATLFYYAVAETIITSE